MYDKFKMLFIWILLKGDLLIKGEPVGTGWSNLSGEGIVIVLDMHFARELNFHRDGDDVEVILIHLDFLLIVGHFFTKSSNCFYLLYLYSIWQ